MKRWMVLISLTLGLTLLFESGCATAPPKPPGLPPPPLPVVEFAEPAPFAGAVWVGGSWVWQPDHVRYEWHHGYWQR
jgi:hypothetical protein